MCKDHYLVLLQIEISFSHFNESSEYEVRQGKEQEVGGYWTSKEQFYQEDIAWYTLKSDGSTC